MLYHNEDGRAPSLLVEDGETVTISARDVRETGIPILKMRARTTTALLVLAGQLLPTAPRLSDRTAFEQIERTDGFVNFSEPHQDGKIAGYSVPFVRGVLEALDPNERVPPRSVKRLIPFDEENNDCGCFPSRIRMRNAKDVASKPGINAVALAEASLPPTVTHSVREIFVPDFISELKVFSLFTILGDIVVGRNATLVLDSDISFAIADNILAYRDSRIVQQANYLNVDILGTMRGSLLNIFHTATDGLKVNWDVLAAELPTKP
jgi:hypothetical protein